VGDGRWSPLAAPGEQRFLCRNAANDACNWLVPPGTNDALCVACRHNGLIPNLTDPSSLAAWQLIELAKHRLFYSLLRWKLPLSTVAEDPAHGLSFEFLADPPDATGPKVLTGHDEGKITIALKEAEDAERERRRVAMGEPYRTLLGHFRHEVGHHYWDVLVRNGSKLKACRAMFGDDSLDYGEALKRHYEQGAPPNWQEHFVSQYATTHPWEDFAETWRTTCTSSIHWRWSRHQGCRFGRWSIWQAITLPLWNSIRTSQAPSSKFSNPGFHSFSRSIA
jgi:hypothetical protein